LRIFLLPTASAISLPGQNWDRTIEVAWVAALLFAVHPVQTEAITYISGRSVSQMSFFYLASMCAYEQGRHPVNPGRWHSLPSQPTGVGAPTQY
jgi:hypothetical protein